MREYSFQMPEKSIKISHSLYRFLQYMQIPCQTEKIILVIGTFYIKSNIIAHNEYNFTS